MTGEGRDLKGKPQESGGAVGAVRGEMGAGRAIVAGRTSWGRRRERGEECRSTDGIATTPSENRQANGQSRRRSRAFAQKGTGSGSSRSRTGGAERRERGRRRGAERQATEEIKGRRKASATGETSRVFRSRRPSASSAEEARREILDPRSAGKEGRELRGESQGKERAE